MQNKLYYGDNLEVLRNHLAEANVDLVYLDPPFNSKRNYNVNLRTPKGHESDAQIMAFEDTWHWGAQAEQEFDELLHQPNTDVAEVVRTLRRFLKESDMMAYLTMMASRLLELHRVLKPTGSLYLHCDPTASHYLKIVLDAVFGAEHFRNEISWKRTSGHNSAKRWGPIHDVIFFYTKSDSFCWNQVFETYDESYLEAFYKYQDEKGRYRLSDLTGAGTRAGDSGQPWKDVNPTQVGRHWAVPKLASVSIAVEMDEGALTSQEKLDALEKAGLIYWPPKGKVPQFKRYYQADKGTPIQDVITDIPPISAQSAERLGYPTQKPLALLERIIQASSNPGDMVLDPFCGCGTATHAAQKLGRNWIGIDITHLAISLIEKRLQDAFPDITFAVHGTPQDLDGARDLAHRNKYEFQWWACALVNAQPYQGKKKGADGGIDGLIYFQDDASGAKKIIVSVKGGDNVSVAMVRDLAHVVEREQAQLGLFVTLAPPTKPMLIEATSAGFYPSPLGNVFPKLQILTIEGLLAGSESPKYPDLSRGGLSFKKARTEKQSGSQQELL